MLGFSNALNEVYDGVLQSRTGRRPVLLFHHQILISSYKKGGERACFKGSG